MCLHIYNYRNSLYVYIYILFCEHLYRINLYRVNEMEELAMFDKTCSTTTNSCEYMAWSPTFSDPPAFHVPSKFGYLVLV